MANHLIDSTKRFEQFNSNLQCVLYICTLLKKIFQNYFLPAYASVICFSECTMGQIPTTLVMKIIFLKFQHVYNCECSC